MATSAHSLCDLVIENTSSHGCFTDLLSSSTLNTYPRGWYCSLGIEYDYSLASTVLVLACRNVANYRDSYKATCSSKTLMCGSVAIVFRVLHPDRCLVS